MSQGISLEPEARADHHPAGEKSLGLHDVTPDLGYQRLAMVNVAFIGAAGNFEALAVPAKGKYRLHPARVENGTAYDAARG